MVGLDRGQSQAHQVRVAVEVELHGPRLAHPVEAGELQHEVVEPAHGVPAERGHHLHGRGVALLDQPRDVAGSLAQSPALPRLEHGRAQPPALEVRLNPHVRQVAGGAADSAHPHVRQRQALDSDDGALSLGNQYLGDGVGIGTGEEVGAGLDEGGSRVGSSGFKGEQRRVVVLGRLPEDGLLCCLDQERIGRKPSSHDFPSPAAFERHRTACGKGARRKNAQRR